MVDPDGAEPSPDRVSWHGRDWTQTAQRRFDSTDDGELTNIIVQAIADGIGVAPDEVTEPTLFECVDMEAVSRLIESGSSNVPGTDTIRFDYDGSMVEVRADGLVRVFAPIADAG